MSKPDEEYLKRENALLKERLAQFETTLNRVAQAQTIECVIENGVEKIAGMLEPLRSLRPTRTPLDRDSAAALHALHASLARPNYENLESSGLDSFIAINTGKRGGQKS